MNKKVISILSFFFTLSSIVFAHPTGNMISVGDHILWSYINPVDDPEHHACIMIWGKDSEQRVFLQSEYSASDYMLYSNQNDIFIIERRHLENSQSFKVRLLKTTIDTKPQVIWDWFKDEWRVGEGGFFMLSDNQMVFGKYPEIYTLIKGKKPQKYFDFDQPVKRIRAVENNQILLLGDNACYLTRQDGSILKQWNKFLDNEVKEAPLNRNQIFDADYKNGKLLIAYWGKRSFELIDETGEQQNIIQQLKPLTPHWVAFWQDKKLLFSSKLIFDGSTPKPQLILMDSTGKSKVIWD